MNPMLSMVAALALAPAQASPLLGKPLPKLDLSHSVQGQAWTPSGLRGRVVVLDLFQLG